MARLDGPSKTGISATFWLASFCTLITETEYLSGLTTHKNLPSGVSAMGLELDAPARVGVLWAVTVERQLATWMRVSIVAAATSKEKCSLFRRFDMHLLRLRFANYIADFGAADSGRIVKQKMSLKRQVVSATDLHGRGVSQAISSNLIL